MDITEVIEHLKAERDKIEAAISALEGGSVAASKPSAASNGRGGRRRISAAGLARIRAAQKARWAKARKAGK